MAIATLGCEARERRVSFSELPRPIIFAHRGGGGEAPESTLPAMLGAVKRDPSAAIEIDVRCSRDGHVVVIHDRTVERTTKGSGRVSELTLAELQALDAGYCASPGRDGGTARHAVCRRSQESALFPFRGKGYRIPTLKEVLEALPRQTLVGIEVKAAGCEPDVAAVVRASGRLPRVVVGSADGSVADRLKALLPQAAHYMPRNAAARFALAARLTHGSLARPEFEVLAVPPSVRGLRLDVPKIIEAARARGVLVVYWTVNDEAEMERLFRLGADGIITDYPGRARQVLARIHGDRALDAAPVRP